MIHCLKPKSFFIALCRLLHNSPKGIWKFFILNRPVLWTKIGVFVWSKLLRICRDDKPSQWTPIGLHRVNKTNCRWSLKSEMIRIWTLFPSNFKKTHYIYKWPISYPQMNLCNHDLSIICHRWHACCHQLAALQITVKHRELKFYRQVYLWLVKDYWESFIYIYIYIPWRTTSV